MKKKLTYIVLTLVALFVIKIDGVSATSVDGSFGPANNNTPNTCSGANCYSLGTTGIRIFLLNKNGDKVAGPVEYWYYSNSINFYSNGGTTVKFNKKYMRQELKSYANNNNLQLSDIYNSTDNALVIVGKKYDGSPDSIEAKLPGILKDFTNVYNGTFVNSNDYLNTRVSNSTYKIAERIIANIKKKYQSDKDYLAQILTDFGKSKSTISKDYYLQIEPILNWNNNEITHFGYESNKKLASSFTFYGTPSEFSILYKAIFNTNKFDVSGFSTGQGTGASNTNHAFNVFNGPFAFSIQSIGIVADDVDAIPKVNNKYIFNIISNKVNDSSEYGKIKNFADGYGVGFISLKDAILPDCKQVSQDNDLVTNRGVSAYVTSLKNKLGSGWNSSYNWMDKASDYGYDTVAKLKERLSTSCEKPACNITYSNYSSSGADNFKDKFIKNVLENGLYGTKKSNEVWNMTANITFGFKYTGDDICGASNCSTLLSKIISSNGNPTKSTNVSENTTDSKIRQLFSLFTSNKKLDPDVYRGLEIAPSCEDIPKNCEARSSSDCSTGIIEFGKKSGVSNEDHIKCVKFGILYYNEGSGSGLKPSLNSKYTTIVGKNVYCGEEVKFEMPKQSSDTIKSGKVFQWGQSIGSNNTGNDDDDRKTFAVMTIYQDCYIDGKMSGSKPSSMVHSNEKSNTEMYITYEEITKNSKIKINREQLNRVEIKLADAEHFQVSDDLTSFSYTTKYRFVYGDNLNWYSSKGSDGTIDNKSNITEDNLSKYVFIGYGIPIDLSASTGTYSKKIKVDIEKIGISGKYDPLMPSDGYTCPFKVYNELFGNECCNKETGLPYPGAPSYCTCNGGDTGPKGLDVVFRTIELIDVNNANMTEEINKAFPGKNGSGRKVGANWADLVTNPNKIKKILKNTVYNDTPMYEIKLTVSSIQNIRRFNSSARKKNKPKTTEKIDPYTFMGEYSSSASSGYIGYTCDTEQGKYGRCVSNFLTYLAGLTGDNQLKGRCMTSTDNNTRLSKGLCE